jgi:hypothetical protein
MIKFVSPVKPISFQERSVWTAYAVWASFCVLFFLSTTYIPNSWEYFMPDRIAHWAAGQITHNETLCYQWQTYSCPEVPGAVLKTLQIEVNDSWFLKLYPGNMLFFSFLILSPLLALLLRPHLNWGQLHRVGVCKNNYFFSTGELVTMCGVGLLSFTFLFYWIQSHNYNGYWPYTGILESEKLARAFGQLAVMFMGLLFFPTARSASPLLKFFNLSWEEGVQYHRWLGYAFLVAAVAHMIANYVWFWDTGVFPSDIFAIPMHLSTSMDNFTVPLVSLALWMSLFTIGIASYETIRRQHFEVFYYLHHFSYCVLLPAVLWHSAAGWEFLLPGVTIWCVDRAIRSARSSRLVALVSSSTETYGHDRVTELVCAGHSTCFPGQYYFLNVPEISLFQWHPFTVSAISSEQLRLHIKAMPSLQPSQPTFTSMLFDLVP